MQMPTFDDLMNPVLCALQERGGSASIYELVEQVIADMQFSQEIIELPHSRGGRTELEYRMAWARTYLKKFGLITNSERAVWSLTPEGAAIESIDPREVVRFVRQSRAEPGYPFSS